MNLHLNHPSILAAMAGRNDGEFCRTIGKIGVGMVTIGGISVDEKTRKASSRMAERGRKEFCIEDVYTFLRENIEKAQESSALVCVNIRSATVKGYLQASEIIADCGAVVEINAHCRQKEMMAAGAGQSLLYDLGRLRNIVITLKDTGIHPLLKFRGNVVSEKKVLETVGCDAVHIDSYQEGKKGFDFSVFEKIKEFKCFKIGNNSINTPEIALKVLRLCDAFSFAQIAWNCAAVKDLIENVHFNAAD